MPAGGNGWDHPRLCGEKFSYFFFVCFFLGSPPPMRGKEILPIAMILLDGITPAYAGKRMYDRLTEEHA